MTNRSWRGQLRIEGETAWWSGSVGDTVSHRHFAAQAVFSDVPIRVLDGAGEEISATCLLIEPNALHQLLPAHVADICYVEPTSSFGLPELLRARIERSKAHIISDTITRSFWKEAIGRSADRRLDARVSHAISAIERLLPDGTVRLADVCADSQLSIGRFRHLFSSEVGMPSSDIYCGAGSGLRSKHSSRDATIPSQLMLQASPMPPILRERSRRCSGSGLAI